MIPRPHSIAQLKPNPDWAKLPLFDRKGWRTMPFGEFAESINERVEPSTAAEELYVGLDDLDSGSLQIRRWGKGSDVIGTKLRFRKGDIIFGRRRAYQRKLAVAEMDGICSAHAMVVRARPGVVLPEFLPFLMTSDRFMNRAVEISVGSLSPTINWTTLKHEPFALPQLDQQRRIARILWGVDEVAVKYAEVAEEAQGALEVWIADKLMSIARAQDGTAPQLGDLVEIRTGKLDSNCAVESGEFPFFTCDTQTLRINTFSFDCEALLLAGNNAVGVYPLKYYNGKFDAYQRTYVITIKDTSRVTYPYLLSLLRHELDELRRLSVGSATKFLTMRVLQPLRIPLPSAAEQQEIVARIRAFEVARNSAATHTENLRAVRRAVVEGFL
jgi:type I restriction enzyme, S subunit